MPGIHNALTHRYAVDPEAELVERTNVFPLAQYSDGSVRLAVPGLIAEPFNAFHRLRERGAAQRTQGPQAPADQNWDEAKQAAGESFDAASLAPITGIAAGVAGAVPEGAVAANGIGRRIAAGSMPMNGPTPETARWLVEHHGSPEAALKHLADEPGLPDWMPGSAEMRAGRDKLTDIIKSELYSNSPTGASVPLLQRLLGQRGGQATAADAGAMAQEMTALQQRHAELFGQPYRTPQPPGGTTPETMAADLAELRGRIQSKEGQLASQPQMPSVPSAGAPRLPAVQPNQNVAKRVAEFGEIQDQVASNPYVQTRDPASGRFVKKAEEKRLINDYYARRGEPLPQSPWGRDPTQYQDVAKAQQQFEQAKQGIARGHADIAKQQQAARNGKGDAKELRRLRDEVEMWKALYEQIKPKADE